MVKHILFEGVDLAGKSTIVKRILSDHPNWVRSHLGLLSTNPVLPIARSIDKDGSEWIGHLYVEALKWDLDNFEVPDHHTIQDSTVFLRTLAYNTAAGYQAVVRKVEQYAFRHPRFDRVYLFTASLEARQQRLKERMKTQRSRVTVSDLKVIRDPDFFVRMDQAMTTYAKMFFEPIIIDTTNISIDDVVDQISLS